MFWRNVVGESTRYDGWSADGGDIGWVEAAGEEDELGVYFVEG